MIIDYEHLCEEHAEWSQSAFGGDRERGPLGPLAHLKKEVAEATNEPYDREEYADCFLLIIDAARRAGISGRSLLEAAYDKLEINKARKWGKPDADGCVEHDRGDE